MLSECNMSKGDEGIGSRQKKMPCLRNRIQNAFRIVFRFMFVIVNNFYCIPVHMVWLLFLYPLKWISEDLYWTIEGVLFRWLLSMVALWSYSAGYYIRELGDDVSEIFNEKTVILFNHQSTSDVPLIMAAYNSRGKLLNNILWIMDRVFKKTNFGLVSWAHGDFFIRAGKNHRDESLKQLNHHLKHFYIPRDRKWIVLFPEGGFLKNRKPSSQRFATKNNLPHLENVSLPRVGALKVILDKVGAPSHTACSNGVKYLVDVTVAYPGGKPLDLQTIVAGWREPCETIFHYRIYTVEELPKEEEDLTNWLYQRYFDKEKILQRYYDTGIFPDIESPNSAFQKIGRNQSQTLRHDSLEFLLRHFFFIASTWLWLGIIYRFVLGLWQHIS